MYLLFSLRAPKDVADALEEEFYATQNLAWETEETDKEVIFRFYFPLNLKPIDQDRLYLLEKIAAPFPGVFPEYTLIKRENWEVIWKYHFKPLKIGKRFWILPTWEEFHPQEETIPVYIDPGQAFGTGHHPTTQLMLENLETYLEKICENESQPRILDMGCGSGILSIAGAKLCPKAEVWAVDIDELALEVTQKNAEANGVSDKIRILKEVATSDFHLILANIGFKELKNLAGLFKKTLHPAKGILILSGVLKEDLPELEEYYRNVGFKRLKREFLKGWSLIVFKAP